MIYQDLKGQWDVFLDEGKNDALPAEFPLEITLPNTTSNAQLGRLNPEKKYGCLTDRYMFEGYAWFRRSFEITPEISGKRCTLTLERTRKTAVFIDGKSYGEYCSLCTPHRYDISGLSAGKHELVVRVDNTNYPTAGGHLTSQDTQTNWNGITGELSIESYNAMPREISVFPDVQNNCVRVRARADAMGGGTAELFVKNSGEVLGKSEAAYQSGGVFEAEIKLSGEVPLWSEHSPKLLSLTIKMGEDEKSVSFGMRELKADGRRLRINGAETFLRGKHDGLVFPKTGFAPTDVESWLNVLSTAKEYGINHYRFHTCCPPDAAFTAADMLGIYMQPELPFWGTIPEEFGEEHAFLREEGFRMLREFSHHASFVMMSMGNELWGSKERLDEMLAGYKALYPDILFTQGSNNYQWVPCVLEHDDFFSGVRLDRDRRIRGSYGSCDKPLGFVQTDEPNSTHCYDELVAPQTAAAGEGGEILIQYGTGMKKVQAEASDALVPNVPIITHEVGQYVTYPDYSEIAKYTGSLKHDTYEGYRAAAEEKGLLPFWEEFFKASGTLAVDCYRREIEAALRSAEISGFQLLDLQDFPGQGTATVGILNAFMESKGLVSSKEWRNYCNDTVVLAQLPTFVYRSGEKITTRLAVSSTNPSFGGTEISWRVVCGGKEIAGGSNTIENSGARLSYAGNAEFCINCGKPETAVLEVSSGGFENSYTLYIYPQIDVKISESEIVYNGKTLPIVREKERAGAGVLCIPKADEGALIGEYSTDFWCYGMFKAISESMGKEIPTGTLGLLIDKESALLRDFPSEKHTTPPWYALVMHSHCAELDGTGIVPDIWVIDNPQRAKRLALLYRDGERTFCTSRLWEIGDRIEVKHFAASLVEALVK